jgi:hypothetical protein
MRRRALRAALVLLTLAAWATASETSPVRRHVVALVEGKRANPDTVNIAHELLEMPLNHLGMVVRYHYVGAGPPSEELLEGARAVLTYFNADTEAGDWLWPWLERAVEDHDLRIVHFGEFGPLLESDPARLTAWLGRFGLDFEDIFYPGPLGVEVSLRDRASCCFEADPRVDAVHTGPRDRSAANTPWVTTRYLLKREQLRTPVVTGPWGGLALDPWAVRKGTLDQDRRWYIDPFRFFREALDLEGVPAPHPSVLNGRRMWMLHLDGDGFESLSTVRSGEYAARVMLDEVFRRYELPFTVSIIVRGLTENYDVPEPTDRMRLAREILNLPHVEPASHGVLHTLQWQEDRITKKDRGMRLAWYEGLANYEYSTVAEVRKSIRFINERLLADGKRCRVMLWTGFANPYEDAIAASAEQGCWNVNGGVFRWDRWHDSVGFVSPWSRRVGRELQVYAGAANENEFEGFYDTMPGAFAHIDETIRRTGDPRILKPANIYIHFYSAEHPARLKSVHDLIRRWALGAATAPVHASVYARAVTSAVRTAWLLRTEEGWAFRDFGDCRTVRIDGELREVDWVRSSGLLGARRIGGSLYLHLAAPNAEVVLAHESERRPHVYEANCLLEDAVLEADAVSFTARAFNPRLVILTGFPPHVTVTVSVDGTDRAGRSDADGRVRVELAGPGESRVRVSR